MRGVAQLYYSKADRTAEGRLQRWLPTSKSSSTDSTAIVETQGAKNLAFILGVSCKYSEDKQVSTTDSESLRLPSASASSKSRQCHFARQLLVSVNDGFRETHT